MARRRETQGTETPADTLKNNGGFLDRVKELRRVRADELVENPANWRTHPPAQRAALRGLLKQVGFAGAVIARELDDGRLMVIDGHLRRDTVKPSDLIPVLVLDVSEQEALTLLATLDPLGAMAEADAAKLRDVLAGIEVEDQATSAMLATLSDVADMTTPRPATPGKYRTTPVAPLIKVALRSDQVEAFEAALMATGKKHRSEAMLEICRFYVELNAQRQHDIQA